MAFYLARHVKKWGRIKKLYFHKFFSSIVLFWWSRLLNVNTESKFLKIFTLEGVLFALFSVTQNAVFIWTKGQNTLKELHFPKIFYCKYTSHFTIFFWKSNEWSIYDWLMLLVCCSSLYIQESSAAAYPPSYITPWVNNAVLLQDNVQGCSLLLLVLHMPCHFLCNKRHISEE